MPGERVETEFLNDTQRDVEASLVESVGAFKRRHFSDELASGKQVRLIFNGQVLREEGSSLGSCRVQHNCVLHCLVHTNTSSSQGGGQARQERAGARQGNRERQGRDLDLSALFLPLLGLALALLWYCCLAYSSAFNLMSTAALLGLTSLYLLSVYWTHFHGNVAMRTGRPGGAAQAASCPLPTQEHPSPSQRRHGCAQGPLALCWRE